MHKQNRKTTDRMLRPRDWKRISTALMEPRYYIFSSSTKKKY
jgi:hypothetical protein